MKVFKFGGASIRNAEAVQNMCSIVEHYAGEPLVVVVSAMGKTTNELEKILQLKIEGKEFQPAIQELNTYHQEIINHLIKGDSNRISAEISDLFQELANDLDHLQMIRGNVNETYDRVVSVGELASSKIIHSALADSLNWKWIDAREYIRTSKDFREAKVKWSKTTELLSGLMSLGNMFITQGFIGSTDDGRTTTLGREGSDFTGAILCHCLSGESLTIWKDVPGILNADPKLINDAEKYEQLSYQEASEMTYYGAKVIHPKTIRPLANKGIPLLVRSFENPYDAGTQIHREEGELKLPTIIFKENQALVTLSVLDYTFINEKNLGMIFHTLDQLNIKIHLMQNSAISLSICINDQPWKLEELVDKLEEFFEVEIRHGLTLITVINYREEDIERFTEGREVYLEQRTRETLQLAVGQLDS